MDELRAEIRELKLQFEQTVAELRREIAALRPASPAPPEPAVAETPRQTERLVLIMVELAREAPTSVKPALEATAQDAEELARQLRGSSTSRGPLVRKAVSSLPPEDQERLYARLVKQLVPEFVDLLETARRSSDPNLPFFRTLESRLAALLEAAELEELRPAPGSLYQPSEQNLLKAVRSEDPSQRDQVERCVSRGFRWRGELVKKAEVTVFL